MMTREEYEAWYAKGSGITVAQLHAYGRYAEPCNCADPECKEWAMGYQWEDAIIEDQARKARVVMTISHEWHECRPAVLNLKPEGWQPSDAEKAEGQEIVAAGLEMAWSLVPDSDRRLFHAFFCLDMHTDETHAAMDRITELIRVTLEEWPGGK